MVTQNPLRLTRTEREFIADVLVMLAPQMLDGHRLPPAGAARIAGERARAVIARAEGRSDE